MVVVVNEAGYGWAGLLNGKRDGLVVNEEGVGWSGADGWLDGVGWV